MFGLFSKKEKKAPALRAGTARYIYRPYENAMSFRVEYREGLGYVYPGWGKNILFIIEGEKISAPGAHTPSYIIIGNKLCAADGETPVLRISGSELYAPGGREPKYVIRDSIRVQGTI